VVTRRLQAERRTGSVHRAKTGVLPTVLGKEGQEGRAKEGVGEEREGKGEEGKVREGKRTSEHSPSSKFATTPLVIMMLHFVLP